MRNRDIFFLFVLGVLLPVVGMFDAPVQAQETREQPIQLHPQNPHYFLFRGKVLALISSGEHYGAVLNADFDYRRYLDALAAEGMNYTRLFGGSYVEAPAKSFGILRNDLAPGRAAQLRDMQAAGISLIWRSGIPSIFRGCRIF